MEKVLVILPDNNKGRYIAKGFSSAFKELSYFVIEKKIFDLNIQEIVQIKPSIVFIFWSNMDKNSQLLEFLRSLDLNNKILINVAELLSEIPLEYRKGTNIYSFSSDAEKKQFRVFPAVSSSDCKRRFKDYKYSITFAGNPSYENREKFLSQIIYHFGIINIFCRSYDFYKSVDDIYKNKLLNDKYIDIYRESYRGYVESQKDLSFIYSHSKINIDLPAKAKKNINYRCMEILASGGFLIAPYNNIIIRHFDDGKEIETYKTNNELIDKIAFYLKNSNLALLISAKGRKNVVSNHSYIDRLKLILKVADDKNISS